MLPLMPMTTPIPLEERRDGQGRRGYELSFPRSRVCRRWRLAALLASIFSITGANATTPRTSAELSVGVSEAGDAFGRRLAHDVCELLFKAACIDPVTHEEVTDSVETRRQSQKRLREWFNAHDRCVAGENCRTKQDRSNLLAFRTMMADEKLLALSYRQRLRIIRAMGSYYSGFARLFGASLEEMLVGVDAGTGLDRIAQQLRARLTLKTCFFGNADGARIVALYVPGSGTIWFDLNPMAQAPAGFIDAFEHELWHHLLPSNASHGFAGNIWIEGFNEAVCEAWSDRFYRLRGTRALRDDTVEYPVQVALASLCLGTAKATTLAALADGRRPAEFSQRRRPNPSNGMSAGTPATLADVLRRLGLLSYGIDDDERQRVEAVLSGWGWREHDGSRISVEYLTAGTPELDAATINGEFRSNRRFLRAFVDALSVVRLQSVTESRRASRIAAEVELPLPLKANLRRVLRYVKEPDYELTSD